jgi:hypothetical protein
MAQQAQLQNSPEYREQLRQQRIAAAEERKAARARNRARPVASTTDSALVQE